MNELVSIIIPFYKKKNILKGALILYLTKLIKKLKLLLFMMMKIKKISNI